MAYGDLEEQPLIKHYVIMHLILLKIQNMMDINKDLIHWFINSFYKKTSGANTSGIAVQSETLATRNKFAVSAVKSEVMSNQELPKELLKPIIKKFEKQKVYSSFIDNIWGADLADMQLKRKFNKRIRFLLCVIYIFGKIRKGCSSENQKGITIAKTFQKILDESN